MLRPGPSSSQAYLLEVQTRSVSDVTEIKSASIPDHPHLFQSQSKCQKNTHPEVTEWKC